MTIKMIKRTSNTSIKGVTLILGTAPEPPDTIAILLPRFSREGC
jgi:hypothetical protein